MNVPKEQWEPLARALADTLTAGDARVRAAVASTPRHVFVPRVYAYDAGAYHRLDADGAPWLASVYSDDALATQVSDTVLGERPTSSSSQPSLMAAMLHVLEVGEGMRVLELGTGTGYNAALLCALVGDDNVFSVDIDRRLVETARARLDSIGLRPHLAAADSSDGYASGAPYDRMIATHAVERVPHAWVAQTQPGGRILVDIRSVGAPHAGHLAILTVHGDGTASGTFDVPALGNFMPDRACLDEPHYVGRSSYDLRDAEPRPARVSGTVLDHAGLAFVLWSRLPDLTLSLGDPVTLSTPDGSWAWADEAKGRVYVSGPVDLWAHVEDTHTWWVQADEPDLTDFGVTVTPHGQRMWLKDPTRVVTVQ